ncbi:hypothetical protein HAX54_019555 [Datura stramonium]|uniref:Uncharacterized protein n=1 Tax=Datura stramonium TaxID=4076 RepID=A0ABS8URS8_DATST|nr:hypothetical protein [Datura stramonium]
MWSLQVPLHRYTNIESTLPSLGHCIVREEIRWGDTVAFEGEYCHIPGYWEWVFCEAWCPKTNTLLISAGELSISLWDLYTLGSLPIGGSLYEEVIPEAMKLTVADAKDQRYTPRGNFLDGYLQTSVDAAGPISAKILKVYDQDYQGGKGSFQLSIAAHVSKKRSSQVVEIHDSVDSPSRTLFVLIKESNVAEHYHEEGHRRVVSLFLEKWKKEATSIPRDRVRARLSSDLQKHPIATVSVFDRKKVVLSYRKMFISDLWTMIPGKHYGSNVDCASSLKEEVHQGEREDSKVSQKREESRSPLRSYQERRSQIRVSTANKDFDACNDADLLNVDDLTDLEQKKKRLEAMRQDLINYKLCLD